MKLEQVLKELQGYVQYGDNMHFNVEPNNEGEPEIEIIFDIDTLQMSEDNYAEFESLCEHFEDEVDNKAYCVYDVSGYNYWTESMNESNYAMVIVEHDMLEDYDDVDKLAQELDKLFEAITDLYDVEVE